MEKLAKVLTVAINERVKEVVVVTGNGGKLFT